MVVLSELPHSEDPSCQRVVPLVFLELVSTGDYSRDSPADRIAFKAVYIPIIRKELVAFVVQWNTHKIRKQKERLYLKDGKLLFVLRGARLAEACRERSTANRLQSINERKKGVEDDTGL